MDVDAYVSECVDAEGKPGRGSIFNHARYF